MLGPNGAGKTTCFYIITGLVSPDYGTIKLDGQDVTELPIYRRARMGIGYLPQEASIFRGLNVENNIRAVLEVVEAPATSVRPSSTSCLRNSRSATYGGHPFSLCLVASDAGLRSRARWRHVPALCCSTSHWPESTRSQSAISVTWSHTEGPRHRCPHHRPQRARNTRSRRSSIYPARGSVLMEACHWKSLRTKMCVAFISATASASSRVTILRRAPLWR